MGAVQMPFVEVVDMVSMLNGSVSAAGAVNMGMLRMNGVV